MALKILSPEVLHERLGEGKPPALIDVLVDEHFKAVHLPGAVNVCVYEIVFLENMAKLIPDKDREIVVYGSGDRSLEALNAAEKLVNAGYRNVGMLQGGLNGWKALGYAVEGEDTAVLERAEQAVPFEDARYVVDTEQSIINWFGRNRTTTHRGTLRFSSGEFSFTNGELKGAFEVDMTSIQEHRPGGRPPPAAPDRPPEVRGFLFCRYVPPGLLHDHIRKADRSSAVEPAQFQRAGRFLICGA